MASNAPAIKQDGLSFMNKLTPNVYLYRPEVSAVSSTGASPAKTPPPKLVLLCSWMGARDIHIAKYIVPYQALYPNAQILLIKCNMVDFLRPTVGYSKVQVAVPIVRAAIDAADARPQLLVHLFSNGGASMLFHLYHALRETAKPGEQTLLPLHATVLDSTPAEYSWTRSIIAMTAGMSSLMKLILWPWLRLWLVSYHLRHFFWPQDDPLVKLALSHNDAAVVKEVRRTYVYSEEDELTDWKTVEKWADDAEQKGFTVRKEKFSGSAHVAHARLDEKRYWTAVKETWEGLD